MVHGGPGARAHGDVARGHGVGRRLEHRRVHDPHERPVGVLRGHAVTGVGEQPAATADLHAGRTQQRAGLLRLAGGEEHAVARVRTHGGGQAGLLLLGDVLGHRAGQLAVLLDEHVGQALGAALLGPLLPRVEGAAGLGGAARHHDGAHVLVLEHAERGVLEVLGQVRQLEAEAQVRLVRAVLLHRLGVGHAADRRRHVHAHEGPQGLDDLLAEGDHVVLLHEGGLDVQLGELGLTVGAEVLVAVAAGDLVVLLDPAHLQQLLEQLRRLRQGVPGAGSQAGRDEEVAGALRRRAREGRGLDLHEALAVQQLACRPVDLGAQAHDARGLRAAQVQVAVAQPGLLADLHVLVHLERQGGGGVEHRHGLRDQLDLTGGQVRVLIALGAALDRAGDLQDPLVAQRVEVRLVPHHDLGEARGVAQVHEGHAAVVAPPRHPAGDGDGLADERGVELAEGVGAQHEDPLRPFAGRCAGFM